MPVKQSAFLCAVIARLLADPDVAAIVGSKVYSHVPQDNTDFPYLRVNLIQMGDWSTKTDYGFRGSVQVTSWSDYHGDLKTLELMDAVHAALHNQPVPLPDGSNVCLQHAMADINLQSDGQTRQGVHRFTALLSE